MHHRDLNRVFNWTFICGSVESLDDDGMAYIRVADDCLLMAQSVIGELSKDAQIKISL